jgi:hypothetical protein
MDMNYSVIDRMELKIFNLYYSISSMGNRKKPNPIST